MKPPPNGKDSLVLIFGPCDEPELEPVSVSSLLRRTKLRSD